MTEHITFALLGLGIGATYAGLGLGLVLTYRGSGVVNFAHGAVAMYATYVYGELSVNGDYVQPIIGLRARYHVGDDLPFWECFTIAVGTAGVLGLVMYFAIFRPLRRAPVLAKVVASIGVMLTLQAVAVLRFGTDSISVSSILPAKPVSVFGTNIPRDRLYLAALAVVAGAVLWAVYRYTRFGLATRAAAENEKGAVLLGFSPDTLAAINWVTAAMLAGIAGILIAPITVLNPLTYTLFVVPALAAALVGRLTSFSVTVAAGIALGMAQSEIVKLQVDFSWIPRVGVREGLPFLIIVAVMVLRGRSLPTRGALTEGRLPDAPRPRRPELTTGVAMVVGLLLLAVLQGQYRVSFVTSMIGAVICLSLVVLTGYVGQISLAQLAFAGVAAFAVSKFASQANIPFPFAPLLAIAVATVLGVLVGIPALRLRGINLALVTIAAAVAVEDFIFANPTFTGDINVGAPVPSPSIFGYDFGILGSHPGEYPRLAYGVFVLLVLGALGYGVARLRISGLGQRMLAVRADERAAAAAGVNIAATKLIAFAMSAAIAGLGGTLIAYQDERVSAASFAVLGSLAFLAVAYLGGITTISGAMVGGALSSGGFVFYVLDRWISFDAYTGLATALGLIITVLLNPEGISGAVRQSAGLARGLLHRRAAPTGELPAEGSAA